jgi:hypothetical protein
VSPGDEEDINVRTAVRRDSNDVSWSVRPFIMVLSLSMSVLGGDGWKIEGVERVGWSGMHFRFQWELSCFVW